MNSRASQNLPDRPKPKNMPKYLSYKAAWERIATSIESEYYLEAVALCESIISDRLISFVQGVSGCEVRLNTGFRELVKAWKKNAGTVEWRAYKDLQSAVTAWSNKRNEVVHGFVKSAPGRPTQSPESFLDMAREAAEEGRELAKVVCAWHKKQLAAHKRGA